MSDFIMNTRTETATTTTSEKEMKIKIAAAAGNTSSVTKDATVNAVAEKENTAADTEPTENAIPEETAAGEEAMPAEEGSEVAPEEAAIAEDGVNTDMTEEVFSSEPAPIMDGGSIGFDDGMFMNPTMETGMAEVKDPLLSSWPFVIGISAAVLLVSVALGALLARRKIKKGIELYED
jgi:hypothetical protein